MYMIIIKETRCRVYDNSYNSLHYLLDFYVNLKLNTDKCIKIFENK